MLVTVRVRPGASRTAVGGVWGSSEPLTGPSGRPGHPREAAAGDGPQSGALVVAVSARAVDGAANDAVLAAVANAFGLRRRQVALRNGSRSRTKVLDLDIDPAMGAERLAALLSASGRPPRRRQ